jgi:hypothetical protein
MTGSIGKATWPLLLLDDRANPHPYRISQKTQNTERESYGKQNEQDDGYDDIRSGIKCQ